MLLGASVSSALGRAFFEQGELCAVARPDDVHHRDAGHDGQEARREIEADRAPADRAQGPQVAHARDAGDQRRDDQRDHQHLQEPEEEVPDLLADHGHVADDVGIDHPLAAGPVEPEPQAGA